MPRAARTLFSGDATVPRPSVAVSAQFIKLSKVTSTMSACHAKRCAPHSVIPREIDLLGKQRQNSPLPIPPRDSISTPTSQSRPRSPRPALAAAPGGANRNCTERSLWLSTGCGIHKTGAGLTERVVLTGMSGSVLQGEGAGQGDHGEKGKVGRIAI